MLPKTVSGQDVGIEFPTTIESLRELGVAFLNDAFHAAGSLPADDQIVAITRAEEFYGGGMGRKLLLDVVYERGNGLDTELFIKFPLDFGHPLRDIFTRPMESEVDFSLLSMRADLPIKIPKVYYADFNRSELCGILISQRLRFGDRHVEAVHDKCQDFLLSDPLSYYSTMVEALAALAGADRGGALGDLVDDIFPLPSAIHAQGEKFPHTLEVMEGKFDKMRDYARRAPQLMPKNFGSAEFLEHFFAEARLSIAHSAATYHLLNHAHDAIALCHWNANLDNAWFERSADDKLAVGLLDWGRAGKLNLARAFWGMICAAELEFLDEHRRTLMEIFVRHYHQAGGPLITVDEFEFLYRLAISVDALHWMCDAPTIVEANLPSFAEVRDRRDPELQSCFLARAQQHIFTVMLNEWSYARVGDLIPLLLERTAVMAE